MRILDPRVRIPAKVIVDQNECWIWQGSLDRHGYGYISVANRTRKVHRVSYEVFRGPIGIGLVLDHLCRVRACCNPYHLESVTNAENMRRSVFKPRIPKTHCVNGHEYTTENSYIAKDGCRFCRECGRIAQRAYQRQKRITKIQESL